MVSSQTGARGGRAASGTPQRKNSGTKRCRTRGRGNLERLISRPVPFQSRSHPRGYGRWARETFRGVGGPRWCLAFRAESNARPAHTLDRDDTAGSRWGWNGNAIGCRQGRVGTARQPGRCLEKRFGGESAWGNFVVPSRPIPSVDDRGKPAVRVAMSCQ